MERVSEGVTRAMVKNACQKRLPPVILTVKPEIKEEHLARSIVTDFMRKNERDFRAQNRTKEKKLAVDEWKLTKKKGRSAALLER